MTLPLSEELCCFLSWIGLLPLVAFWGTKVSLIRVFCFSWETYYWSYIESLSFSSSYKLSAILMPSCFLFIWSCSKIFVKSIDYLARLLCCCVLWALGAFLSLFYCLWPVKRGPGKSSSPSYESDCSSEILEGEDLLAWCSVGGPSESRLESESHSVPLSSSS